MPTDGVAMDTVLVGQLIDSQARTVVNDELSALCLVQAPDAFDSGDWLGRSTDVLDTAR